MSERENAEYSLTLRPSAYLTITTPDGTKQARVDVAAAHRFLHEATSQPSEAERWKVVRNYLASALKVESDQIAENVCWQFHEVVTAAWRREYDLLKKSADGIACSLQPIPVFHTTSYDGPKS